MYSIGRGCEKNEEKAFNCYAISSTFDKTGKYMFARYLYDGKGCKQDVDTAISLFVCYSFF